MPSQTSTTVSIWPKVGTVLDVYHPTAVHEVADVHDTPVSWLPCVVLGLGVDWTVQADPSHDSATVPS